MKNEAWELFTRTGNPAYYLLYKELTKSEDGHNDKGDSRKKH